MPARLSAALVLFLVPAAMMGCRGTAAPTLSPERLKPVKIAVSTLPASAPVFVAHEQGFFRDEGLDDTLATYGAGRLALAAVLEGKADLATVAETPIARAVLDGKSPVVVATICEIDSANIIVARRDRGITRAEDLRGKRVGVATGTSADFFLHIYLVTSGIDPKDVRVVPLPPDESVGALTSSRVDAVSAFAPYSIEMQDELGDRAVVLDEPGLYTTYWNVAMRQEESSRDPDLAVRFLRAITRANEFVHARPGEAQAITAKWTGISVESIRGQWAMQDWEVRLDQPLILALEDESRWMSAGATRTPDFLRYIDPLPLRRVRPSDVDLVVPKG